MGRARTGIVAWIAAVAVFVGTSVVAQAQTVITFYSRSNATEVLWVEEIVDRFNAEHTDIEVRFTPSGTGGGADYAERLAVLRAGGNSPDVFTGFADKLGFILNGWTLDLTPFVERDRAELDIDDFFPGVWSTFAREGRIYGIPFTVTPQFIFYNRDMFAEAGLDQLPVDWNERSWTWDAMVETSRKLTIMNPDGSARQLGLSQATESHIPDVVWLFGGDWFPAEAYETGRAERATFTRPENITAYTAVFEVYQLYAAAGPPKGISAGTGFAEGRIGMDWIGAWKMDSYMTAQRSGGMTFSWGLAPVPLVENRANTRWNNPLYIAADTPHPDAAWTFVKYATSPEAQWLWAEITGKLPARRSALPAYLDRVAAATGMPLDDLATSVSGALAHSRRSLEESIGDVQLLIVRERGRFIDAMLAGLQPIGSALQAFEDLVNAHLRGAQ